MNQMMRSFNEQVSAVNEAQEAQENMNKQQDLLIKQMKNKTQSLDREVKRIMNLVEASQAQIDKLRSQKAEAP
jgi:regulator of sirC expression with transglutaminase-like and TPR domain